MEVMRESIFVTAVRSFCRSFFALCGIFLALAFGLLVYSMIASPYAPEQKTELKILPDLKGSRAMVSADAPVVLHIDVEGVIGDPGKLDTDSFSNILIDSRTGLLSGDRVKAIFLYFNTPGGGAVDSDSMYRLVKKYKEKYQIPVFGYVEGLCASGGMYIACAADRMYASATSVIGSVGVLSGPFFNISDAMTRYGVQGKFLSEGTDKTAMNPFEPWKPGDSDNIQAIMASMYNRFVDVVTAARPQISRSKLINEYGARVYDATLAQQYGYIDVADADSDMALAALLEAAKIDPEKPYQVVQLEPRHSLLSELVQGESACMRKMLCDLLGIPSFQIKEPYAYLYKP